MQVAIINTGSANLNSVNQALIRLGCQPVITADPEQLRQAERLILPGVGTATAVMDGINRHGLRDFILSLTQPVLGICLGMQIMTQASAEVPRDSDASSVPCLGIVDATVEPLAAQDLPLPHMGWNRVHHQGHPLFDGIPDGSFFYFVHSYAVGVGDYTIGECEYGMSFSAALARDNFLGVQFHPEKSGATGARLLQNFLNFKVTK